MLLTQSNSHKNTEIKNVALHLFQTLVLFDEVFIYFFGKEIAKFGLIWNWWNLVMNSSLKESTLDVLSQLNKESAQIGFSGLLELTGLVFFNTSELVNTKLPMQGPLINQRSLNYVMNSSLDLNLMFFFLLFSALV